VSHLKELNLIEARAEDQLECFKAGLLFARNEGIIPAPESTHAIKSAIDEALICKKEGVSRTIAFNLSGHGLLDLGSYATYFAGNLENADFHPKEMEAAIMELPVI
jgi:tryptophan synthase beta chain